jgi:hypothetical protein
MAMSSAGASIRPQQTSGSCDVNDVRNLMRSLGGDVEYREFGGAAAAPAATEGWPVLKRFDRLAGDLPAAQTSTLPEPDPEPPLATQMRAAAIARSGRGGQPLSLGQYSPRPIEAAGAELDDPRRQPLSAVFERLAQARR